jgi:hypothetical protein
VGQDFPHLSRPVPGSTQPPVQWVPGLSRDKGGRGVMLITHPHSRAEVKKELSYNSTHPMGPSWPVTAFPLHFKYFIAYAGTK